MIDPFGTCASIQRAATMRVSVALRYDPLLLAAARNWTYTPAMLDGRPVKYRKIVQVSVQQK